MVAHAQHALMHPPRDAARGDQGDADDDGKQGLHSQETMPLYHMPNVPGVPQNAGDSKSIMQGDDSHMADGYAADASTGDVGGTLETCMDYLV